MVVTDAKVEVNADVLSTLTSAIPIPNSGGGGTEFLGGLNFLGDEAGWFTIGSSSGGSKSGRRIVKAKRPTSRIEGGGGG